MLSRNAARAALLSIRPAATSCPAACPRPMAAATIQSGGNRASNSPLR
ncbi:hypothetical protein ACN28C_07110 [Plantactinospora sp. WMMC1484]